MKQLLTIVSLGLLCGLPAFCQEPTNPMFSSSLVAWTTMQTPQPPEGNPLPPRSGPEPQPNVQVPENPPDSSTAQPAAQTFTGIVSQQGDTYVLSGAGSKSYKLDDQDRAKQFDGQKVRVLGILDQGSAIIHVQTISPLS